jgi:uncharacterized protein
MVAIRDNSAARRFELDEGGHTAYADYRRAEGRLIIDHVEAPPALRGTGAAGRLMEAIAERATRERLSITPLCGYAAAWLKRHPQYADL